MTLIFTDRFNGLIHMPKCILFTVAELVSLFELTTVPRCAAYECFSLVDELESHLDCRYQTHGTVLGGFFLPLPLQLLRGN